MALELDDPPSHGAEREHLLDGTRAQIEDGLARYAAWRTSRSQAIESGSTPHSRYTSEAALVPEAAAIPAKVVEIDFHSTSHGGRFAKLVHAVLQSGGGAAAQGCRWNATPDEIRAAEEIARVVLKHPGGAVAGQRHLSRDASDRQAARRLHHRRPC